VLERSFLRVHLLRCGGFRHSLGDAQLIRAAEAGFNKASIMPRRWTVWMGFSKLLRRLRGIDPRQCDEGRDSDIQHRSQGTRADTSAVPFESSEQDVVVNYDRANQGRIGQQLRDRYDEFAQEELPRDILETLADLNQRLKRRDGD